MFRILALLLCFTIPTAVFASETGYKVTYDGGSLPETKSGASLKLAIGEHELHILRGNKELVVIPAASVTEISYGQDVHRRVGSAIALATVSLGAGALLAFSKSKKHFVGITWADGDKKGGFAVQCDKNDYRGILAGLEGVTGKKAVDSQTMTVKN